MNYSIKFLFSILTYFVLLSSCSIKPSKTDTENESHLNAILGENPINFESESFDSTKHGFIKIGKNHCNATLVSENTVILALHCVQSDPLAYVGFVFEPIEGPSSNVVDAYLLDDKKDSVIYALDRNYPNYYEISFVDLSKSITIYGIDSTSMRPFSVDCEPLILMPQYAAFSHNCDTKPGFSGSAIIQNNKIVGLHNAYQTDKNINIAIDFGMLYEEAGDIYELNEALVKECCHIRSTHVRPPHIRPPEWLKDSFNRLTKNVNSLSIRNRDLKLSLNGVDRTLKSLNSQITSTRGLVAKGLTELNNLGEDIKKGTRHIDQERLQAQKRAGQLTGIDAGINATRANIRGLERDFGNASEAIMDATIQIAELATDNDLTRATITALKGNVSVQQQLMQKAGSELDKAKKNVSRTSKALVDKTVENLQTPEGQALIAVGIAVATSGAGAAFIGATQGTIAAAVANAAVTSVTQQVIAGVVSGKPPIEAIGDLGSEEGMKSIGASILVAGAISYYDASGAFIGDVGSTEQKVSGVVSRAAIRASINTATHGGKFSEAFARELATEGVNIAGQEVAREIGTAFDHSDSNFDTAMKYVSHAGAGCATGLVTSWVSEVESEDRTACTSGAVGAVAGEAIGSYYRESDEILEAQDAVSEFVSDQGEMIVELRVQGYSDEEIMSHIMADNRINEYSIQLDAMKQKGVQLAKFGSALAAYAAGADAAGINIAATTGEIAAENNAIALVAVAPIILAGIDIVLQANDLYEIYLAYESGNIEEGDKLLALFTGTAVAGAFVPGDKLLGKLAIYAEKHVDIKNAKRMVEFLNTKVSAKKSGLSKLGSINDFAKASSTLKSAGKLPDNYITKAEAKALGWKPGKGNLVDVAPGKMIGGDIFKNAEGKLPSGTVYREADLGYRGGRRGSERLIYGENGRQWVTSDHYKTFTEVTP